MPTLRPCSQMWALTVTSLFRSPLPSAEAGSLQKHRRRTADLALTAKELALDPQTDEEDMAPPSQRTTVSRAAASAPAASATPASPSVSTSTARPASIPVGTVTPTPSNKSSSGRPPTTGGSVPRRQGKVKEVPKDTTKSDMMMAMVQKGNNEAARWAVDDRAERVRQEERRVDLAQELRRDTDHIDQLAQAKEEREMVGAQLALALSSVL
ncbi:hypothetical protein KEM48_007512 [Puccinia striiformis f. sp. tritici PST-130]|nr:hypothetical protein KEM48_007512 [Puccinia striiformis f. sp. tritici PST-130]